MCNSFLDDSFVINNITMTITYECVLLGTFKQDLKGKIENKLLQNSNYNCNLHVEELVFRVRSGVNQQNGRMVMKRDLTNDESKW